MKELHGNKPGRKVLATAVFLCAFAGGGAVVWAGEPEKIIVIGTTPVRPAGMDARGFPGRVQNADSAELARSVSADITDYLNRSFSGVHINSAQGNPLQPDLYYRGFAASPLLGLPVGLTVYQNGVRLNEPLGDTINWELVPMNAVAGMSLVGGANALYGLNTLGGSVVLDMKNGFTHPGNVVEVEGGSYERFIGNIESGANNGEYAYYFNAQRFYERGWRDFSQSWAENLYASLEWRGRQGALGINYQRGLSKLTGNGPQAADLLDDERDGIFTAPDITENDLSMWTLKGDYLLGDETRLSGNLYYRDNDTGSFNGDAAEYETGEAPPDCDMPMNCDAINNISARGQETVGGVFQVEFPFDWLGHRHHVSAGAGYREGRSRFDARVQNARLDPATRSTLTPGAFTGAFQDDDTRVKTRVGTRYLYAGDTVSIGDDWTATLSGYYHDSAIRLRDRTGEQPELNGSHDYNRFNWGAGAVYHWRPDTDFYGGYSESSRLPTPIELACSEQVLEQRAANNPGEEVECRLPNAFLADPPLDEVISTSFEFGARGTLENGWSWSLGGFHTRNKDDILFQTTGRSRGVFKNVDETRRLGVEAALSGAWGGIDWTLNYTRIEATFEDRFLVVSPNHANAADLDGDGDADEIQVRRGDRIPGIPRDLFKAAVDYEIHPRLSVGLDMIAVSGQYLRGDESNEMGRIAGYATFNARANYRVDDQIEAFLRIENLFDKDYENFGLVGEEPSEVDVIADRYPDAEDPRFLAPGAPVSVWVGMRLHF